MTDEEQADLEYSQWLDEQYLRAQYEAEEAAAAEWEQRQTELSDEEAALIERDENEII